MSTNKIMMLSTITLALLPVISNCFTFSRLPTKLGSPLCSKQASTKYLSHSPIQSQPSKLYATSNGQERLQILANLANSALESHASDIFKPFNARVTVIPPSSNFQSKFLRLGLTAATSTNKDETIAAYPYFDTDGSGLGLTPQLVVFEEFCQRVTMVGLERWGYWLCCY